MARVHIGVQQVGVLQVPVQIQLRSLHDIKLLNAVIEFADVRKLELVLVHRFSMGLQGKISFELGILKLLSKLEGLSKRVLVQVFIEVLPHIGHLLVFVLKGLFGCIFLFLNNFFGLFEFLKLLSSLDSL